MQRTVPRTASDPIQLFMRTYYSLLRTTDAVPIQSVIESYLAMESSLHVAAREDYADVSALVYTGLRLPACITRVQTILLGQTNDVFEKHGFQVDDWQRVNAPGRRRRMLWDGDQTLAVFISSRSDVDDLLPILVAYQIEWNKIYLHLRHSLVCDLLESHDDQHSFSDEELKSIAGEMGISVEDFHRLGKAWGANLLPTLKAMSKERKHFRIQQLAGSLADYRKATARWWADLRTIGTPQGFDLESHPVYFVSSNLHSMANMLSGFAVRERDAVLSFLHEGGQHAMLDEYETIITDPDLANNEPNFLYYALKKYGETRGGEVETRRTEAENAIGMLEISSQRGFDVDVQLFKLSDLREDFLDPRLSCLPDFEVLRRSDAYIMNIDYPLGVAAHELLSHLSSRVGRLLGMYVMGKAATLNGAVGDVMISSVVHDEHSENTYLFQNAFNAMHVSPYMVLGSVLDNQKAVTVYGTFLQNPQYMDVFYEEGYTVLEMEAGPFLSAAYESVRPRRHPQNELVRLYESALDIGIIHYASDTPFSRGQNLGAGSLGYAGVESTYAASIAILQRIFRIEARRMESGIPFTRTLPVLDF